MPAQKKHTKITSTQKEEKPKLYDNYVISKELLLAIYSELGQTPYIRASILLEKIAELEGVGEEEDTKIIVT